VIAQRCLKCLALRSPVFFHCSSTFRNSCRA
jgi:hypothetical protein